MDVIEPLALERPEFQILLACSRTNFGDAEARQVASLAAKGVDWEWLSAHAERHCVTSLIYRNLSSACSDIVPAVVAEEMRRVQVHAQRSLLLVRELLSILSLLEGAGIPAIPFKGPALALQAYGNLGLRQFGDLDVWIRPRDFRRARELMVLNGYQPYLPPPDSLLNANYSEIHHEYGFISGDGLVHLELLWRVIQRPFAFPADTERLWLELETRSLGGRAVLSLPAERMLLCLCVHGSKHLWSRLSWVCDVAEFIRATPELSWNNLLAMARASGVQRMLLLGLSLAHQLLDAPVPGYVLRLCAADAELVPLARLARQLLVGTGAFPPDIYAAMHLIHLRMLERTRDRVGVFVRYSYTVLKPIQVYKKYGLAPLRRLFGL